VRVRVTETQRRFVRGQPLAILEPGPDRIEPRCPVFGHCGGCSWQHLAYGAQVEAKRAIVRDAFTRIGHLELPDDPISFVPSPQPYGYRLRARLHRESGAVGYLRRGSHALCATDRCPILVSELEALLPQLATQAPPTGRRSEFELAAGASGETRVVRLPAKPRSGDRLALPLAREHVAVSPGVFAQANLFLLEPLAAAVHDAAGGGARLVELFAGSGFLTLGLARRFGAVTAVEADAAAIRDLEHNLEVAALSNVRCVRVAVERALERELSDARPEIVVLDPPRSGLPRGVPARIARLGARRIVYLSCDPATLARDAAQLVEHGYALKSALGFDLFPQTPHVEVLAVLQRPNASGTSSDTGGGDG
jgi:23S rRNA (uracil1939-C5)-methyltransferase